MLIPLRNVAGLGLSCVAVCIGVVLSGCSSSDTSQVTKNAEPASFTQTSQASYSQKASAAPAEAVMQNISMRDSKTDACNLLRSKDIQSIQGEALKDAKPSERVEGGLHISQCFYSLTTFSKSIALTVMLKENGRYSRDPKEFWKETFHRDNDRRANEESEAGEKEATAERVSGIGDEAFWTGSRVGGALYVLKGNSLIRLSIGGSDNEKTRIAKSKALAQIVLKRLWHRRLVKMPSPFGDNRI